MAAGLLLLGIPLSGQAGKEMEKASPQGASGVRTHLGYPQDWSSQHLLMPGTRAEDVLAAGARDPRHVYNMVMRQVALENARKAEEDARIGIWGPRPPRRFLRRTAMKIDWAVSLENGYVPQNQFPAKYRFDIDTEDCNSDYVVFGLTVTSGTQANLVGVNNLYTGAATPCNGGFPWVAFAYNTVTQTGGQIETSLVLSEDGTKVAFVESTGTASYFHVLVLPSPIPTPGAIPSQVGTVLSPQTPTTCTTPTAAGCMTTLLIETGATNSNSSPWVDYGTDTAYVGADNGYLYKITPVFGGGAPALVKDPDNWPVLVSNLTDSNTVLTAPVVDDHSGLIFLGDGSGYLYSVSLTNPGNSIAAQQTVGAEGGGAGTGIVDPPIAVNDPASPAIDQVFAFTGCSNTAAFGGAVVQVPANFTFGTTPAFVNLGSADGKGTCTGNNVHSGTFDNAFWLNGSATGHMIACGFVSGTKTRPLIPSNPQMYMLPFASFVLTSTGSSTFVIDNTKGDECSPLTEFYNETTDMMFFGVGNSATATPDGFLESSTIGTSSLSTPTCTGAPTSSCVTAPSALGGTSGIVIDNEVSDGGTNIYFSTMAPGSVNGQNCSVLGGTPNPYCAVKLTQSELE
jgi:hypothetical protein